MSSIEIRGATVLTMVEGDQPIADGIIAATDGVLTYVGARDGYSPTVDADEVVEASGCAAMPGFVNAHTHCAMTLMRGWADDMDLMPWLEEMIWPAEANITADDVYWGTMLGCVEMLRAGVTCFNDMYHNYEAACRGAIDSGIRACPSGVLLGILPNAEQMLADSLAYTADIKAQNHPRIHPMLAPHAPYTCPDHLLRKVTEGALELDVPVHTHVSETKSEVADSREQHGQTPVEHLAAIGLFEPRVSAAHCVWLTDQDIEILAHHDVGVVHCPGSNLKLASGIAPVPKLLAAGVHVGLGTDGTASNNNLDMLEEARLAALIHKVDQLDPKVIDAQQALTMATRGSAEAIGLGEVVGSLEVGKRADVVVVDLSAPHLAPGHNLVSDLVYAARASDVRDTIVDGVVVMRGRGLTQIDEAEVIAEASRRGKSLVSRVAGP